MPGLVKRTTRTTQPQTAVGVDWGNSICVDMDLVFVPSVREPSFILGATSRLRASSNCIAHNIMSAPSGVASNNTAKPGEISIMVLTTFRLLDGATFGTTGNTGTTIYSQRTSDASISPTLCVSNLPFAGGGGFRVWFGADSAGVANGKANSTLVTTNTTYTIIATASSSEVTNIAINGLSNATTYSSVGIWNSSWGGLSALLGYSVPWTSSGNQDIALVVRWSRTLSAAEVKSLSDNPWQIFQPDRSYLDAIYQERLTISPDESRWMGSQGRSMEVSEVVQKHISVRTSQPTESIEIDWDNPVTLGLTTLNYAYGSLSASSRKLGTPVISTIYAGLQTKSATPFGVSLVEPNNAEGTSMPGIGGDNSGERAYLSVFWIKNGSITSTTGYTIGGNTALTAWNSGSTTLILYWYNNSGERSVGFYSSWNNINVSVSGVSDGIHTVIACQKSNAPILLFLDGKKYVGGTTGAIYSNPKLSTCSFRNPSIDNAGVGTVLLRAGFQNNSYDSARFLELSKNPWQLFKPQQKTLVYEQQTPKVDPPVAKVKAAKLVKHVRTQQPQLATPITTHTLGKSFNTFIDVFAGNIRLSKHTGSRLSNLIWDTGKFLDSEGSYYITHGNPGAAISVGLNTSAKELTYHVSFREIGVSNGHFIGNAAPNYGVNKGTSILRGATLDAVMIGAGPVITTVVGPARILNKWRTLTLRIHNNGVNSTLSLFDNGILFGTNTGAFVPATQNAINLCTTMADYYTGTHSVNIRSVGVWDRALSDAEIKSISDNPWQIFQPESKTVWVDA